jgi:hypothetical protein
MVFDGNMSSFPAASIWQIAKMAERLLLAVMLERVTGSTTRTLNKSAQWVLYRVECGDLALQLVTPALVPSPSRSSGKRSRTVAPASSSMEITDAGTSLRLDASSSPEPFETSSLGRGLEP